MPNEIDYIALGARIRDARRAKGLTQERLGELCSLSTAYIGHLERGTRVASLETLARLSRVLHVSMDYLLFDSISTDESEFTHIAAILSGKDKARKKTFLSIVRILADKIDEL